MTIFDENILDHIIAQALSQPSRTRFHRLLENLLMAINLGSRGPALVKMAMAVMAEFSRDSTQVAQLNSLGRWTLRTARRLRTRGRDFTITA